MLLFDAWQGLIVLIAIIFGISSLFFTRTRSTYIFIGVLLLAIGMHAGESQMLPAWSVCFQREVAKETLKTPCEMSAQFRDGSQTFRIQKIEWAENFIPLYFMNDKQAFNFYKETEPDRDHLPYSMRAQAALQGGNGHELTLATTIPKVKLFVDGKSVPVSQEGTTTVSLSEDRPYTASVEYSTERKEGHALTVQAPLLRSFGSTAYKVIGIIIYALFGVVLLAQGRKLFLLLEKQTRIILVCFTVASVLLFMENELLQWVIMLLLLTCFYLVTKDKTVQFIVLPGLLFLAFHTARNLLTLQPFEDVFLPYATAFLVFMSLVGFFAIAVSTIEKVRIIPWIGILLLVNAFAFTSHTHPYGELVLFTGGDDELTHEGFAREALLATTMKDRLTAGEAYRFYYQPFYRYAVAIMHSFWGESMFGVYVVQTLLLSAGLVLLLYCLSLIAPPYASQIFSLLFSLAAILPSQSLLTVVQRPFQQGLGTPLLLICSALVGIALLKRTGIWLMALFGILLGLMVSIRTDYLPAALVLLIAVAVSTFQVKDWNRRMWGIGVLVVTAVVFPLLVVARNAYIDGSYALMPTSGLYNLTDPYGTFFAGKNLKEFGTVGALFTILNGYRTNISELFQLMSEHLTTKFITTLPIRQILWHGALPAFILALLAFRANKQRVFALLVLLIPASLVFPNLFFVQHNGIAMLGHYDVYWMLLLAMGIAALLHIRRYGSSVISRLVR